MRTKKLFMRPLVLFMTAVIVCTSIPVYVYAEDDDNTDLSEYTASEENDDDTPDDSESDPQKTEPSVDAPIDEPSSIVEEYDENKSLAESEETTSGVNATTSAIIVNDSSVADQMIIEAYLTDTEDTEQTIKPCDIIFVLDQSKWMNTEDDKGAQREDIIYKLHELLDALAAPTEGEHRIAIAGYGRVNMNASTDPYDADIYPGIRPTGSSISLNTGYYTTGGFVTQNGWTDVSASAMSGTSLPKMSDSYKASMSYDSAFMSIDEAESIINSDTMLAWNAGASRMDAGLTIAEQLAAIANEHDPDSDRNLIVCILASSLPIQNTVASNQSVIRTQAVIAASENLKAQGATIFAFGDYHYSGRNIVGDIKDTEETFNSVMSQVCSQPDYFYSFSNFTSVSDALNEMITKITVFAASAAEVSYIVQAQEFTCVGEGDGQSITWQEALAVYGDDIQDAIAQTMATVEYYSFIGYDSEGNPSFDDIPYASFETPLTGMVTDDMFCYQTSLVPFPSYLAELQMGAHTHHGNKVVITIAAPIPVNYLWASNAEGYAPATAILPDSELMILGTIHNIATVKYRDNINDEHYQFDGWYMDSDCNTLFTENTRLYAYSSLTLYGKWEKFLLLNYYWNIWETDYSSADSNAKVAYGETPDEYAVDVQGYSFDGWYYDKEYTLPYSPVPLTQDTDLYAKWIPNTDTKYTVKYYLQNIDDENYTLVEADTETLTGTTDYSIATITKTYAGFTLSYITYEDGQHTAQDEPLTICGDNTLVVNVYYTRDLYKVTYDLNGADIEEAPVDENSYLYNDIVTVTKDSVAWDGYNFMGWNTQGDGSGTSYNSEESFNISGDTTLYAQWQLIPTWELHLLKQSDGIISKKLSGVRFALYTKTAPDEAVDDETADSTAVKEDDAVNVAESQTGNTAPEQELTVDDTAWYLFDIQTTDDNGVIDWSGLTEDEYYLLELEAPEGYALGSDSAQIVTADFDEPVEITIINFKEYALPNTGGTGTGGYITTGLALVMASAVALPFSLRIKRKPSREI